MSSPRHPISGCPDELIGFGAPSMTLPIASDSDMIAVPRSLLGAASYCARHHAGADSETYKQLNEAAMCGSKQNDQHAFLNLLRGLRNIDGRQLPELTWGEQIDFVQNPVKYFIQADEEHQSFIWRELMKRQVPAEAA